VLEGRYVTAQFAVLLHVCVEHGVFVHVMGVPTHWPEPLQAFAYVHGLPSLQEVPAAALDTTVHVGPPLHACC
jgi:hypothetical protein